jgi:formate hydrogenlyase subunit 6/NADH:ubiquinone oxidoreductase subunit I
MSVRILDKGAVGAMVGRLMADYQVYGPQAKGNKFIFAPVTDPADVRLDYGTTILSPKVALLPSREQVAAFRLGEQPSTEPVVEAGPMVIFGAHTCDLHAIRLLDRAFTGNHVESHYVERRRQTLIVSLECLEPCDEHSFCKDMGTHTADDGYDLHLTDVGDAYAVEVGTQAGQALLDGYADLRPPADADARLCGDVLSAKWPRFRNRLDFDAEQLPALLATAYEHPLWQELGERCLSCGSCTNVCPTCFCFNVQDTLELDGENAVRTRNWDSCQLDEFALVAGGESFRETRAARQRHRFFRKGKWLRERYGVRGCVGCGRCIRTCLVHINIVDGFNAIHRSR